MNRVDRHPSVSRSALAIATVAAYLAVLGLIAFGVAGLTILLTR